MIYLQVLYFSLPLKWYYSIEKVSSLIYVFDLDGTIVFNGQPISKTILQSLKKLREEGHEIIFASARPIRDMLPVIDKEFHDLTMIGGNGSLIWKEGKVIKSHTFPKKVVEELKELINLYQATYLIDGEWNYAYTGPKTHPIFHNIDPGKLAKQVNIDSLDKIVKVLLLTANDMDKLSEQVLKLEVFVHRHHNEDVIDISPKGIHKGSALKSLGIEENTYIAFGNDANDISMFEHAFHNVMIGSNEQLAPFAKESLSMRGDVEQAISDKILSLL